MGVVACSFGLWESYSAPSASVVLSDSDVRSVNSTAGRRPSNLRILAVRCCQSHFLALNYCSDCVCLAAALQHTTLHTAAPPLFSSDRACVSSCADSRVWSLCRRARQRGRKSYWTSHRQRSVQGMPGRTSPQRYGRALTSTNGTTIRVTGRLRAATPRGPLPLLALATAPQAPTTAADTRLTRPLRPHASETITAAARAPRVTATAHRTRAPLALARPPALHRAPSRPQPPAPARARRLTRRQQSGTDGGSTESTHTNTRNGHAPTVTAPPRPAPHTLRSRRPLTRTPSPPPLSRRPPRGASTAC